MGIVVPNTVASGKPWVFRGDPIERDSTVDQGLLAKGFHIVVPPISGTGPAAADWDKTYQFMVNHGFSKKPVMEGTGAAGGECYAWAILNPDKVSCIFAENPVMRTLTMSKTPLLDSLAPLARAGVPLIHDCGSLDPFLKDQTRVVEQKYKELGGQITVIIKEGVGHFPRSSRRTRKPIVDFIVSQQKYFRTRGRVQHAKRTQMRAAGSIHRGEIVIDRRQFLAGAAAMAAACIVRGQQTEGPPGPSGPISIKSDRPTLLMGDEAVIAGGPKPQSVGHGAKRLQVGNWTSAEDSFTWQVDVPSSDEFLVTALTRSRGAVLELKAGSQKLERAVETNWDRIEMGRLRLDKGVHALALRAAKPGGRMEFYSLEESNT